MRPRILPLVNTTVPRYLAAVRSFALPASRFGIFRFYFLGRERLLNLRLAVLAALAVVAVQAQQGALNCHEALAGYRENRTPFEIVRANCPAEVTGAILNEGNGPGAQPRLAAGRVIDVPTLAALSRTLPDSELVAEIGRAQAVNISAAQLAAIESSFSPPVIAALRNRLGSSMPHRSPAVGPVAPAGAPYRVSAPAGASVIVIQEKKATSEASDESVSRTGHGILR